MHIRLHEWGMDRVEMKKRREALDLTQKELAGIVGVPHGTYVNWELGRSKPRHVLLEKLETVLTNLEQGKGTSLTISLSKEEYRQLSEKAERQGKAIDEVIEDMKKAWLGLLVSGFFLAAAAILLSGEPSNATASEGTSDWEWLWGETE